MSPRRPGAAEARLANGVSSVEWLGTVHARIEAQLRNLKLHLDVARLVTHARSIDHTGLVLAAHEYDVAQKHLDRAARSLARPSLRSGSSARL